MFTVTIGFLRPTLQLHGRSEKEVGVRVRFGSWGSLMVGLGEEF